MKDYIITGRARTLTYTHDDVLGAARELAQAYDVTSLAYDLLVNDPTPRFDLLDYSSLLPPTSHAWVEFEVPPVTNLEGRLELVPLGITAVGVYLITRDLEQLSQAEKAEVWSLLPYRTRWRVRRRTRYVVKAFILVEHVEGETSSEKQLFPPVLAHYYFLSSDGRMTLKKVVQLIYNVVAEERPPERFFEAFRSFQYPVFESFERLRKGVELSRVHAKGCDHAEAGVTVDIEVWP